MYIDDNNYDTAIENLDDCIAAINNMIDYTIKPRGFASKEDYRYLEPRFSEANRYIISLLAHPKHNRKFKPLHSKKAYSQVLYEEKNIYPRSRSQMNSVPKLKDTP